MPKHLTEGKAAFAVDLIDNDSGDSFFARAQPGQVPVVNANRDGFEPGESGGGQPGPPNVLTIGTVTTGASPNVTITGESPNQVLNFTLQRGPEGRQGDVGEPGAPGPANSLTIGTVDEGSEAQATITGTAPSQVLNLVLPQGPQGAPGDVGQISIGTVTSGAIPEVSLTGSPPNQVLNFVLPRGQDGTDGLDGAPGPQGVQGPPGLRPDDYGNLTEQIISDIEAGGVEYIYVVNPNGDQRADQNIPAGIAGDQSLNIIGWSPTNGWQSYGQFTGLPGAQGPAGPAGTTDYNQLTNKPKRVYNASASGVFDDGDTVGMIIVDRSITFSTAPGNAVIAVSPTNASQITGRIIQGATEVEFTIPAGASTGAYNTSQTISMDALDTLIIRLNTIITVPTVLGFMFKEV